MAARRLELHGMVIKLCMSASDKIVRLFYQIFYLHVCGVPTTWLPTVATSHL